MKSGSRDLSCVVATAIATIRVGGAGNDCLFTAFEVKKQVLCVDFAALILGVSEISVLRLSELLRAGKHSLTEGHAKAMVAATDANFCTGMNPDCTNFYFQEFDGHVGIGCADLRNKQWFFESDFFFPTTVFLPGSRVLVRSYAAPHPVHESTITVMGPVKTDSATNWSVAAHEIRRRFGEG